ncbi:MAG TPA: hypothetical protein VEC35_01215 [Noviherbaspirillum sp.]|nr:hypothetical protein [Noviherbaspirillum sp.]
MIAADIQAAVRAVTNLIEVSKLSLTDEKQTQVQIATVLDAGGVEFEREARLSDKDIVDFLVDGGVAVEVKIKGQRKAIYRQLERYSAHESVKAIVLVTSVCMHLPADIGGKPASVASLSKGWL